MVNMIGETINVILTLKLTLKKLQVYRKQQQQAKKKATNRGNPALLVALSYIS